MLTLPQTQRYAFDSGIRDLAIVEKEIVLTHLLQRLAERGVLEGLAFKGGTCIRKTWLGAQGRFSTDLDFTSIVDPGAADDFVLGLAGHFEQEFHGLHFSVDLEPGRGWYQADDGDSWGMDIGYRHAWAEGAIRVQVSHRERPTLPPQTRPQLAQSYFRLLDFAPAALRCLAIEEILAEKLRAACQRHKPRDLWDLYRFSERPLPRPLIRALAVVKLWQAGDALDWERLRERWSDPRDWDWDDLRALVRGGVPEPARLLAQCRERYAFLGEMTPEERDLAADPHRRRADLHARLVERCHELAAGERLQ